MQHERGCVQVIDQDGGRGEVQSRLFYPVDNDVFSFAVVVADVTYIYIVGIVVGARSDGDVLAVLYPQREGRVTIEIIDGLQVTVGRDGEESAGVSAVIVSIVKTGVYIGGGDAGGLVHSFVVQKGVVGFPQLVVAAGCKDEGDIGQTTNEKGIVHAVKNFTR